MTSLADAMNNGYGVLSPFDGQDVISSTIAVTKAGDGLSAALSVDPQEWHLGQRVYVVLETTVGKVQFVPIKDTDALRRVHVLVTEGATIVDAAVVKAQLDAQADKIRVAHEQAQGIQRLTFDEDDPAEVLARHHQAGLHTELVAECPTCAEEKQLSDEELGE